ncbi:MAG: SGNH/GDSL hydrolase family protein [Acidobacteriota bacterium]
MKRIISKLILFFILFLPLFPRDYKTELRNYVALGDSLTAGFQDGGLVVDFQIESFPALLAKQIGIPDFQQPLVSQPGIPPTLQLISIFPQIVILPKPGLGKPINLTLPRPYNNIGVPGASAYDLLYRVTDFGGAHDLILRGLGTQLQQAIFLKPNLITLWIGNNDVLKAVMSGRVIEGITLTPVSTFQQYFQAIVNALKSYTTAKLITANVPDVTSIPFVTTVPIYVVNPTTGKPVLTPDGKYIYLIGPKGPLSPGDYVTLYGAAYIANKIGIPKELGGTGIPLPDGVVLDKDEISAIRDRANKINEIISSISKQNDFPVFDINAFLKKIGSEGFYVGGVKLTTDFLTGGLFSLDAVHPSSLGYGILANELIKIINEHYEYNIPLVNLYNFIVKGRKAKTQTYSIFLGEDFKKLMLGGDIKDKLKDRD